MTTTTITSPLTQRGIHHAAERADWQPYRYRGSAGWRFPLYHPLTGAVIAQRWKRSPGGTGAKYLWLGKKPAGNAVDWYLLPGTRDAIERAGGVVYLANGEPSLLAYHAAGVGNVIATTLSEISVPDNTIQLLRDLGVTRLLYPADNDAAGEKSALKWREALRESGIDYAALHWGDDALPKADANDCWIACDFDAAAFQQQLRGLAPLDLPAPAPKYETTFETTGYNETSAGLVQAITSALEARGYKRKGEWLNGLCLFHEDSRPSAGVNRESGVCNCFVCGEHSPWQVAEHLGIDPTRFGQRTRQPNRAAASRGEKPPIRDWRRPVTLPSFPATDQVHLRYISELPLHTLGTVNAIRSPLATGKTQLAIRLIQQLDHYRQGGARVLVITHLRQLARNACDRLNAALDYPVEYYADLPRAYRASAQRLVVTYDSLHTVRLSDWDLVIVDEIEQLQRHLQGGTLRGGRAVRAYRSLTHILQNTQQSLCLDAHLSATLVEWLGNITGKPVTAIENTYRHDWGTLTIQQHRSALLGDALHTAATGKRGTVITTNSREQSWLAYEIACQQLGTDAVRLVNGDTSDSQEARETLQAFTSGQGSLAEALPGVQLVITSPSVGTGVDVQLACDGVYALIVRQGWTHAYNTLQQVLRYRQAAERQLCIMGGFSDDPHPPQSWQQIYLRYRQRAEGTAAAAHFAAHALPATDPTQDAILRLQAKLEADIDPHRRDLFSYVLTAAEAEGFRLRYRDRSNPLLQAQLLEQHQTRAARIKTAVLAATPLSPERLEQIKHGQSLPQAQLLDYQRGVARYRIEQTAGQSLTADLYDRLHSERQRDDFCRLLDLLTTPAARQQHDRTEAQQGILLTRRRHATRTCQIITLILTAVFGEEGLHSDLYLTKDEISRRLAPVLAQHYTHIEMYLDTRPGLSRDPLHILRRVLKRIGLQIADHQLMRDGIRFYRYGIDAEQRDIMLGYAQVALQARQQLSEDALLHSVKDKHLYTKRSNRSSASQMRHSRSISAATTVPDSARAGP